MKVAAIENDKYLIRPVTDTDKVPFMRIRKENSDMSRAYDNKMFFDYLWAAVLRSRDEVSMVVFLKENGSLIAVCSFRDVNTGAISIGIDLDTSMQSGGAGTEILSLLVSYLKKNTDQKILTRTKSNNLPCQKMIIRAGGIKISEDKTEFDCLVEDMIPSLEKDGLSKKASEARNMLNWRRGIFVNTYEFCREGP